MITIERIALLQFASTWMEIWGTTICITAGKDIMLSITRLEAIPALRPQYFTALSASASESAKYVLCDEKSLQEMIMKNALCYCALVCNSTYVKFWTLCGVQYCSPIFGQTTKSCFSILNMKFKVCKNKPTSQLCVCVVISQLTYLRTLEQCKC